MRLHIQLYVWQRENIVSERCGGLKELLQTID